MIYNIATTWKIGGRAVHSRWKKSDKLSLDTIVNASVHTLIAEGAPIGEIEVSIKITTE